MNLLSGKGGEIKKSTKKKVGGGQRYRIFFPGKVWGLLTNSIFSTSVFFLFRKSGKKNTFFFYFPGKVCKLLTQGKKNLIFLITNNFVLYANLVPIIYHDRPRTSFLAILGPKLAFDTQKKSMRPPKKCHFGLRPKMISRKSQNTMKYEIMVPEQR